MRPFLLLAAVLFLAAGARAQGPVGVWSFELSIAESGQEVDGGVLEIPEEGEAGFIVLENQNLEGELVAETLTLDGDAFTLTGTLGVMGNELPLTIAGTADAEAMEAEMTLPGQPAFAIAAARITEEELAAYMDENAPAEPGAIKDLFEPMDLPAPNRYRSASGRPGPDYWQQRTDYTITASLDTTAHRVTGTATLRYTNNSPEDLPYLWFHLEQNLFRPDSRGVGTSSRGRAAAGEPYGYELGEVTADGRAVTPVVTDTRMRIDLPEPVRAGGGTVEVTVPYAFVIPDAPSTPRMGRLPTARGTVYSIAQWFPRVAVFDDVNGWNHQPYLGPGEFYLGYGDYELALTVPATMTVVSAGALQNPDEVLTRAQRERVAEARRSDERVYIVRPDEVGTAAATPKRTGTATWRFRAENVRDVAWAASAAFIHDAAGTAIEQADGRTNNVLIQSAYPHEGVSEDATNPGWEEATRYGKASIENNSYWYPYPYPVAVSVASHVGGMEYPMIHFSSVRSRHFGLFGVIDHELGHNWYPMIVGSDEKRHAWMDEGFNTFINAPSAVRFYDENADTSIPGYGQSGQTQGAAILQADLFARLTGTLGDNDDEILTYADQLDGNERGWNSYFKPGMGLTILRTVVLGQERFDAAFKAYTRDWAYKHPQPADFFRSIENGSGEDLDWFWRGWFDTVETYDAELVALEVEDGRLGVTVTMAGGLVMPVDFEVAYADGSTSRHRIPVEAFGVQDEVTMGVALGSRTAVAVTLDPDGLLPDTDRTNDSDTVAMSAE